MTNDFYASQEGAALMPNGMRYFHFYGQVAPNKFDLIVKTIKEGEGYPTLAEALSKSLSMNRKPEEDEQKFIDKLRLWVNMDFGKGLGEDYPELKLVAWAGTHNTQKPVVFYTYKNQKKWVTHPQIQLMVQRYGVYYGAEAVRGKKLPKFHDKV
jgi:hypothetical protein